MALMIPEICDIRCNTNITKGERKIFNLLKNNLSDDYTVYFDTNIDNEYPDFVVVGKDIGIVVLEVKDYKISTISKPPKGYGNLNILVNNHKNIGKVEKEVNPYNQARTYVNSIKNKINLPFKFNFNSIVVFTQLKEKDLEDRFYGYEKCIPKDRTIYKEDLDSIENKTQNIEQLIKSKCQHLYYSINDKQIYQINNCIYPISKPNLKKLEENMDKQIEEKLEDIQCRKYVLQGVSGSGKTVYLTTLAKLRLNLIKKYGIYEKILITAFNNTLISYFKSQFSGYTDIDIKTKYELMNQRDKKKYDLILIDEGQDFSLKDLQYIIHTYLNKERKEFFMIGMDGAQNIYNEKNFKITDIDDNIVIKKLTQNYRNNKSIFEFSNAFLNCNEYLQTCKYKEGYSNFIIDNYKSLKKDNKSVSLIKYNDFQDKMNKIKSYINYFKSKGVKEKDICIMYVGSKKRNGGYLNKDIQNYLDENYIKYYDFYTNKKSFQAELSDENVNISTIHSSKGFEYKVVILCGLEKEFFNKNNDLKKLIYTGMTRAKDKLIILINEKNDVTNTLEKTYEFMYELCKEH